MARAKDFRLSLVKSHMNPKWESTPVENITFSKEKREQFLRESMEINRVCRPPVEYHKQKLGKQHYTWIGEYRFWVWEGQDWRVFCSNKKGICFEVRIGLSKAKIQKAWDEYKHLVLIKEASQKIKCCHHKPSKGHFKNSCYIYKCLKCGAQGSQVAFTILGGDARIHWRQ
jgi:hypothetical protein